MKIRLFILVGLLILPLLAFSTTGEDSKPQKFEVVFTVKYNSMTLAEAAAKETEFRKKYADACEVKVAVNEPSSFGVNGTIEFTTPPQRDWFIAPGQLDTTLNWQRILNMQPPVLEFDSVFQIRGQ